ncbi:hypothetical protein LTSERUB_0503 [Salmonella enterica subsp. enterica serovar Rubislaw str. A4-653]|uniref:Uncharacterized protein n=1 Tax=Salmonella enterica subsp. enterica serovar Rubislaw str. A4-653 TaxID=913081 RepID=G5QE29_SALRU|nr:hypothetical protein LTSERUB_0503 [Salmonella enterica subsp. enterica serovar Rubislaw str. A4-653]
MGNIQGYGRIVMGNIQGYGRTVVSLRQARIQHVPLSKIALS